MKPGKSVAAHHARPVLNLSALQRDVIRAVAFLAMAGDHIATAFQADLPLLNMAGRCAFPLFALVSGCNMAGKTLRQHSLNRLWLMALLAQPGYWLAFRDAGLMWWQLNILFAFAIVMQVARFLQAATVLNGVAAFTVLVGYSFTSLEVAGHLSGQNTGVSMWAWFWTGKLMPGRTTTPVKQP